MAFDERSGIVACKTPWGRWWQTVGTVEIEIESNQMLSSKEVKCEISNDSLSVAVKGNLVLKGKLWRTIKADESTWVLEEKRTIQILLSKCNADAANCWPSLLADGEYSPNFFTLDAMQKKLTLERFQTENPGMDFSSADISGNYQDGGPRLPI